MPEDPDREPDEELEIPERPGWPPVHPETGRRIASSPVRQPDPEPEE